MRIHFFIRTLNATTGGGSHYNSIAYVRALRKAGHTVTVHVLYGKSTNTPPHDITPVMHDALGLSFLEERAYLAEQLRTYESDADVFFLYAVEFAWGGGLYRRTGGTVPVVVYMDAYLASMQTIQGLSFSMAWYGYKRLLWDKTFGLRDARYIDRFLPCSPYIGEKYIQYGFPKNKFTLLPNIVPNVAPPHTQRNNTNLHVLYVGRLDWVKGVDLAVEAMASVTDLHAKLIIVGDGEMRPEIEEKIKQTGIHAEITGWIPESEVGKYYEDADVFLHPARWPDPAPRTIVGAVQYGIPLLVPDTGGSSWIAGDAALVYKTGNVKELTNALRQVLTSTELRAKLTQASVAQTRRFEENMVVAQLENILKEVRLV